MYRLRVLQGGLFQIHSSKHKYGYEGTPRAIFMAAIQMGVPQREILIAVNELEFLGGDYADFNRNGKFLRVRSNEE